MEEGWKDVKNKSFRKRNVLNSSNNDGSEKEYGKYYPPFNSVEVSKSSDSIVKSSKYQPPSMKNKKMHNSGGVEYKSEHKGKEYRGERGGKEYRGGRGGKNVNVGTGANNRWNKRVDPESIPDFANEDEKEKFMEIRKKSPHIMLPGAAKRMAITMRIDNFAEMFTSDEWVNYQRNGWKYVKVIKPDEGDFDIPDDGNEYDLLSLENKWGDYVLFLKIPEQESDISVQEDHDAIH